MAELAQAKLLRRCGAEERKHFRERHAAFAMQDAQRRAQRRLQPRDAIGRALELNVLFVRGMRRMICGDHIHRTVEHRGDAGITIVARAQRRIHLEVRVVAVRALRCVTCNCFVGIGEMMR